MLCEVFMTRQYENPELSQAQSTSVNLNVTLCIAGGAFWPKRKKNLGPKGVGIYTYSGPTRTLLPIGTLVTDSPEMHSEVL